MNDREKWALKEALKTFCEILGAILGGLAYAYFLSKVIDNLFIALIVGVLSVLLAGCFFQFLSLRK